MEKIVTENTLKAIVLEKYSLVADGATVQVEIRKENLNLKYYLLIPNVMLEQLHYWTVLKMN